MNFAKPLSYFRFSSQNDVTRSIKNQNISKSKPCFGAPGHGDGTSRWIGQNRHQSWSSGNEWGREQSLEQMIFVLRELKDMVFCCVFAQVLDFSVALLFLSIFTLISLLLLAFA